MHSTCSQVGTWAGMVVSSRQLIFVPMVNSTCSSLVCSGPRISCRCGCGVDCSAIDTVCRDLGDLLLLEEKYPSFYFPEVDRIEDVEGGFPPPFPSLILFPGLNVPRHRAVDCLNNMKSSSS